MKNLKFESIDLFKNLIVEGDRIVGGYDACTGKSTTDYALRWDPVSNQWVYVAVTGDWTED